jgi:hypothetical protein
MAALHTNRVQAGGNKLRALQHLVGRDRKPTTVSFVIQCVRSLMLARDSLEDVNQCGWLVRCGGLANRRSRSQIHVLNSAVHEAVTPFKKMSSTGSAIGASL